MSISSYWPLIPLTDTIRTQMWIFLRNTLRLVTIKVHPTYLRVNVDTNTPICVHHHFGFGFVRRRVREILDGAGYCSESYCINEPCESFTRIEDYIAWVALSTFSFSVFKLVHLCTWFSSSSGCNIFHRQNLTHPGYSFRVTAIYEVDNFLNYWQHKFVLCCIYFLIIKTRTPVVVDTSITARSVQLSNVGEQTSTVLVFVFVFVEVTIL